MGAGAIKRPARKIRRLAVDHSAVFWGSAFGSCCGQGLLQGARLDRA